MASLKDLKPDHVYGASRSTFGNYSPNTYGLGLVAVAVRSTTVTRAGVTVHPVDLPEGSAGIIGTVVGEGRRTGRQLSPQPFCSLEEWPEYAAKVVAEAKARMAAEREREDRLSVLRDRAERALTESGWTGTKADQVARLIATAAHQEEMAEGPKEQPRHLGGTFLVSSGAMAFLEALEALGR